jgi:hypothetical protein
MIVFEMFPSRCSISDMGIPSKTSSCHLQIRLLLMAVSLLAPPSTIRCVRGAYATAQDSRTFMAWQGSFHVTSVSCSTEGRYVAAGKKMMVIEFLLIVVDSHFTCILTSTKITRLPAVVLSFADPMIGRDRRSFATPLDFYAFIYDV